MSNKIVKTDKDLELERMERIMEGVSTWASYYRANPHRFCSDYLNIVLKTFQEVLLVEMNDSTHFMYIAARGQGKTFLVAVFCIVRCILYPGTKICIASKTRKQATEVLEKIRMFMKESENLCNEISEDIINQASAHISFHNTSRIFVATANQEARSARANILIIDEFRMVDLSIINFVLKKFITTPRQPRYLRNPEYEHMLERNKEFYLSSAWYMSHWSFEKLKSYAANLVDDKRKYFLCGLPYQLSIAEGLLSREQLEDEMTESDWNELAHSMEMECLWFSDNDGDFYSYDDISKTRKIKYPMYPTSLANKISDKRVKIVPKVENERRILSADVALMSSKRRKNDAASIFINQLIPTQRGSDRYVNNIIYTENHEGMLTDQLALLIRRLFHEFECTDLVLDAKSIGFGVFEHLVKDIYDPETGETYEALSCCNNEELAERCLIPNAPKAMWVLVNQTAKFNSDCAIGLREAFKQGKVRLLLSEFSSDEELGELRGYNSLSLEDKVKFQLPYVHTGLLVHELINLNYEARDGIIKVKEKSGERKDRYSSLAYNIWASKQIEAQLKKPKATFDAASVLKYGKRANLYGRNRRSSLYSR